MADNNTEPESRQEIVSSLISLSETLCENAVKLESAKGMSYDLLKLFPKARDNYTIL